MIDGDGSVKIYKPNLNKNFAQIGYGSMPAKMISKIYLDRKYENYRKICLWIPKRIKSKSILCIKPLGG